MVSGRIIPGNSTTLRTGTMTIASSGITRMLAPVVTRSRFRSDLSVGMLWSLIQG